MQSLDWENAECAVKDISEGELEVHIVVSSISGSTTEAGGTATFTVKLNSQPTANVTIGVSSSDTGEGTVSPSSLTFTSTNWNDNQTVTVTGVNDFLDDGNQSYAIVLAAAAVVTVATAGWILRMLQSPAPMMRQQASPLPASAAAPPRPERRQRSQ